MAEASPQAAGSTGSTVMVLNFNGRDHLASCFESLGRLDVFVPGAPGRPRDPSRRDDVWLVDNASTDGSVELVRSLFPWVRVIESERNLGFSAAYNRAAALAASDELVFLNNDTRVDPAFVSALRRMRDLHPDAFAVAGRIMSWDGSRIDFVGADTYFTGHAWQRRIGEAGAGSTFGSSRLLFGCAGALSVRREEFLALGGFDPDYFSFFEDVDLGWRATLLGHDTWFAPDAVVRHAHHGSWGRRPPARITYLTERNALLTSFKNYHEDRMGVMLLLAAALTFLRGWHSADRIRLHGEPLLTTAALVHLLALADVPALMPGIRQRRARIQAARRRSDEEALPLFGAFASPPDALGESYRGLRRSLAASAGITDGSVGGPFRPEVNAAAEEAALALAELCRGAVATRYPAEVLLTQDWDPSWEHQVSSADAGALRRAGLALERLAAGRLDRESIAALAADLQRAATPPSRPPRRGASVRRAGPATPAPRSAGDPTVSVVVRTKDRPESLRRALASLAAQSRKPDEVVVVDDGEIDPASVLGEFEASLTIVEAIPGEPLGRTRAAQLGLETATGTYVGFLDDDDELLPRHLRTLLDAVASTGARVAYADVECAGADAAGAARVVLGGPFDRSRLRFENTIPIIAVLAERSLLLELGGFEPALDYFEDWDLWLRLAERAPFHHCPAVTAVYHLPPVGASSGLAGAHRWPALARLFERHRGSIRGTDWAKFYQRQVEPVRASLRAAQDELTRTAAEAADLAARLRAIEGSRGWRLYQWARRWLGRR